MNYYPPCSQADKVIGITPHSDGSMLSLLVQVNEVEGLQINKNGKWIPVKPIPGAIIVNIGDMMEVTNLFTNSSPLVHRFFFHLLKLIDLMILGCRS